MFNFIKVNFSKLLFCICFSFLITIFALKFITLLIPDDFDFENWQIFIWVSALLVSPIIIPAVKKYARTYSKSLYVSKTISTHSELFWFSQAWVLIIVSKVQEKVPYVIELQEQIELTINNKSCIFATFSLISFLYLFSAIILLFKNNKNSSSQDKPMVDLYGREPYVSKLAQLVTKHINQTDIISTSSTKEASPTVWLNANWGQGKTFIIKLLSKKLLEDNDKLVIVEFQPTDYVINENTIERIVQSFYQEVIDSISENYFVPELSSQLRKYSRVITQKAQESFLGFSPLDMFEEPENIKSTISKLLKKYNINLILVYDDIDRLTPKEILLFLKLVRITNNFDNTLSIISACMSEVTKGVHKELQIEDTELFVSKFYDLITNLPPILSENLFDKMAVELKDVYGGEKKAYKRLEEIFGETNYLGETHHHCISNIRKQEQLTAEFKRFKLYKNDLCWDDVIKISVIKLFNGGAIYTLLRQSKNEICGEPSNNSDATKRRAPFFNQLDDIFKSAGGDNNQNAIKEFLNEMFPRISNEYLSFTINNPRPFAIYEHDYFDRYFSEIWLNDWLEISEISKIKQQLNNNEIDFDGFKNNELSWAFRMFSKGKDHYRLSSLEKKNLSIWLIRQKVDEITYVNGYFIAEAEDYISYELEYDQEVLTSFIEHAKLLSDRPFFDGFDYVNKIYWQAKRKPEKNINEVSYLKPLVSIVLKELVNKIENSSENILKLYKNIDDNAQYFGYFRNVGIRFDKEYFEGKFKIEELFIDSCKAEIKDNIDAFIVYILSYKDSSTSNGKIDWEWESHFSRGFVTDVPKELLLQLSEKYLQRGNISEKYKKFLRHVIKVLEVDVTDKE